MMKKNIKIIQFLNTQLMNQLTTINQYFLHARIYKHWGLEKIAEKEYIQSIMEMKHADKIINRILMLNSLPNMQISNTLFIGKNTIQILEYDLKIKKYTQQNIKNSIQFFEKYQDYISRELFQYILNDTEKYINWIDTQLSLINKISIEHYLQLQIIKN